ncbi:hypothetical protein pdam_00025955 [Pocillopora damicornis]|uniref:SWIM-type domain-containing protein n=1 Tax=Pocillopora damicornis TaxID=46731 RepID=A0A3M6UBI8_POCDA|nr:hypothetical protein pdam_00025955 [Pocillopora damicornis]
MVDYSMAEINAIKSEFPDVEVYISDFHRGQAGTKDVSRTDASNCSCSFEDVLQEGRGKPKKVVHGKSQVQEYCEVWLDCSNRWAHAFRVQQAVNIVNINNGIEARDKLFKYSYLPGSLDKSVFGIVVMIPSCKCESWRKTHFPCKHILAVFSFFDKWSFNNLPNFYKNSVFITLDTGHFDRADPDEEPTLEPSSTDEGNDDYGQVCGAETTVPALSSNEDDAPAQSSGTSS